MGTVLKNFRFVKGRGLFSDVKYHLAKEKKPNFLDADLANIEIKDRKLFHIRVFSDMLIEEKKMDLFAAWNKELGFSRIQ